MKSTGFLLLSIVIAPAVMAAPTYRWVDDEGVTNYTDTPSKIPDKYKAEITSGDELGLIATDRPASRSPSMGAQEQGRNQPYVEDERAVEAQWRTAFRDAYARIGQLQATIEEDRHTLDVGWPMHCNAAHYLSRRGGWVCLDPWYMETTQRIRNNEAELKRAQEALDDLERYASREAIPREWRRP
jgi:hypothetical protein